MAEVATKTKIDWRATLENMSVGDEKKFEKKHFHFVQKVRITASRLKEKGYWSVSANEETMTFIVKRES